MGSKFKKRGVIYLVVIVAIIAILFYFTIPSSEEVPTGTMNELISAYEVGKVTEFEAQGDYITGWSGDEPVMKVETGSFKNQAEVEDYLQKSGVDITDVEVSFIPSVETGTMTELISAYERDEITKFEAAGDYLTGWDADVPVLKVKTGSFENQAEVEDYLQKRGVNITDVEVSFIPSVETWTMNELVSAYELGEITKFEAQGNYIAGWDSEAPVLRVETGPFENQAEVEGYLQDRGVAIGDVEVDFIPESGFDWGSLLFTLLPLLLFVGVIWFIFSRARGAGSQAMSFGKSKARLFSSTNPSVTFNDVAGVDEAKTELEEVVEFLKNPEKFSALGARIPRGVLLVGSPGTGKTLLSRAVAGEAGVPFYSMSGSEFVEMFVGVGASRVRDLFEQAKRNSPCIIFIDEIDAVGRHRGAGLGGGHDEREQTLNQILVEMDGFETSTNVIVLAATNRPDILDPALLRPGRFDRQVMIDRPDIKGRKAILEVHAKGMPFDDSADLETVAKQTPGFTGADLANLVNEAAILAARRDKKQIGLEELEESVDRVIAGPERKSRIISPKEKEITAYHESGHALVARMLPNADPVHKVSIIARGMTGGYTRLLPKEDRYLWTRSQFNDVLATLLGGHCAEVLIFNEMSTGPESDIGQATKIAHKMVTEYGMSKTLGPRTFGRKEELIFLGREISEQKDYGDKVADEIDEEVQQLIQQAYSMASGILAENKGKLVQLAEALISSETIEGEELEALFNKPVTEAAPKNPGKSVAKDSPPKRARRVKKRV